MLELISLEERDNLNLEKQHYSPVLMLSWHFVVQDQICSDFVLMHLSCPGVAAELYVVSGIGQVYLHCPSPLQSDYSNYHPIYNKSTIILMRTLQNSKQRINHAIGEEDKLAQSI